MLAAIDFVEDFQQKKYGFSVELIGILFILLQTILYKSIKIFQSFLWIIAFQHHFFSAQFSIN